MINMEWISEPHANPKESKDLIEGRIRECSIVVGRFTQLNE
jgi:hypothetical protein